MTKTTELYKDGDNGESEPVTAEPQIPVGVDTEPAPLAVGLIAPPGIGIYYNVPPEVYHSWDACSHSWLRKIGQSPAHLLDLMENGWNGSTSAQGLGSAVHCAVLEPDKFCDRYAVREDGVDGNTKAGKAFKAQAQAENKCVLSCQDGRWCAAIARRVRENRLVKRWLRKPHETEVSLVWERDGYLCKARMDMVVRPEYTIPDLKTTITASREGFARQVAKYDYHNQAAWYVDGMTRLMPGPWAFVFIAAEKQRPFLCGCHYLSPDGEAIEIGKQKCDEAFGLYKICRANREWPGYEDAVEVELPAWAVREQDEADVVVPLDI